MTQAYNLSQLANRTDSNGRIDISTATTGTLPLTQTPLITAAKGGTGVTTIPTGAVMIGAGTGPITTIAPGAINNVLISTATGWASAPVVLPTTVVSSLTGTPQQVNVSGTTGNIVLSLPQSISSTSLPQFAAIGVGTNAGATGTIRATGDVVAFFSDDRLKDRGDGLASALDRVCTLNGFYFTPNETAVGLGYSPERDVGLSAQEVKLVLPEAIRPAPADPQYMTIQYDRLIPLLVEAIKELAQEVDALQKLQRMS